MYCGACRKVSPDESNFCSGCGKPLKTATSSQQPEKRYSVVLTATPQDDFDKFRTIKQLAEMRDMSEKESAVLIEHTPSIVASVGTFAEAETLQKELHTRGVETVIRPYGKEEFKTINGNGKPSAHNALPQAASPTPLRSTGVGIRIARPLWLRLTYYGVGATVFGVFLYHVSRAGEIAVSVFTAVVVTGLIGALIGQRKGRVGAGLLFGWLLGPLGWLVVALGPNLKRKCPYCRGVIAEGAVKCKHCGSGLP